MLNKSLYRQTLVLCVLLISGCDVAQNAQRDLMNRFYRSNGAYIKGNIQIPGKSHQFSGRRAMISAVTACRVRHGAPPL